MYMYMYMYKWQRLARPLLVGRIHSPPAPDPRALESYFVSATFPARHNNAAAAAAAAAATKRARRGPGAASPSSSGEDILIIGVLRTRSARTCWFVGNGVCRQTCQSMGLPCFFDHTPLSAQI